MAINTKTTKSALIAASVAGLVAAIGSLSSVQAHAAEGEVSCHGVNKCKGTGECGGKGHGCAGQNACKGQGWISISEDKCLKLEGGRLTAEE